MSFLSFIPDALIATVVNGILISGVVLFAASFFFGFVVRYIPALLPYRMLIQIVSIPLLVAGIYFKAGLGVELEWRAKVEALNQKVKEAEAKSAAVNVELELERQKKVKVVHDTKVVIQEKIIREKAQIDSECKITPPTIEILNNSARNQK